MLEFSINKMHNKPDDAIRERDSTMTETMQATGWYAGATRAERLAAALARHRFAGMLALGPENAAWLSGRTSTIATLWRLPGLVAVAAGADGALAVAAGDQEVGGYATASAGRFPHPLWIEHHDLRDRDPARALADRVANARPAGALERPAQFDPEALLDAAASATRAAVPDGGRVGIDLAGAPRWVAAGLERRLRAAGIEPVEATGVFDDLRAIKDPADVARLRLAAELTGTGIAAARDALRPGLSAQGVVAAYQSAIWARAAAEGRFAELRQVEGLITVGDGTGPTVVGPGVTVKLDMQVDVGGMHSDVGRTYAIAPTAEQREVFAALREALAATIAAMAPDVPFRDVWAAGTGAMRAAGFAGYSRGHLGHSVGLAHHYEEAPFIAADEARPLAPGMVLSVELPWYLPGIGQFQLERMVLVGESGCEVLDRLPLELAVGPRGQPGAVAPA